MNTLHMAGQLALSRIRNARGHALLDALAVVAFSVSSWLLLTTAGGVWMFYQRLHTLVPRLAEQGIPAEITNGLAEVYMSLAVLALGLLIIPLLSLGASAARLGANGRARRLASLRLIGLSAGQVNLMTLVETLIQSAVGFAIGGAIYLLSLPAWSQMSFATLPISSTEMLLPWWGWLAAAALIGLITMGSTLAGLWRVSISPLGVSRRETPKALRYWRGIGVLIAVPVLGVMIQTLDPGESSTANIVMSALMLMVFFLMVSLAGPLFIQLAARPVARTAHAARLIGTRRVLDDPRAAWRNVSAVSLMALVAAVVVFTVPIALDTPAPDAATETLKQALISDITKGVTIALAFSLILGATGTLIYQAADVFDRADEAAALIKIGLPYPALIKARMWQVIPPLLLMLTVTISLGALLGIAAQQKTNADNLIILAWVVILGVILTLAAVASSAPIQAMVLSQKSRRND
ncbi:FtsX-like permease family protein [Trueperella abortisuis]|uniref:FtsX-like permease family protein n=1 Tax=Trueperella abortisuis TaxID=445930 RepID=UPI002892D46F|nr:FtsX-like permease family protein [Trueperella abortisuis]